MVSDKLPIQNSLGARFHRFDAMLDAGELSQPLQKPQLSFSVGLGNILMSI
ncbi:hypothetical protein [Rhizobium leguminosarum]